MKKVLFTQRIEVVESYGERRDCADQRISEFIWECGFLPVPVPSKTAIAERMVNELKPDGIILTGGNSLTIYGGNAPERDEVDRALIGLAIKKNIPLYGFCRGMQSILDYFGNELVNVEGHVAKRHIVIENENLYEVNSYHNQACIELKENCGLQIIARSRDGVIEAVAHKSFPIIGTMWHPEREDIFSKNDVDMVKNLFL